MSDNKLTATDIQIMVEEVIADENEHGVAVVGVEPYRDYFQVKLDNDVFLSTLNAIARKIGTYTIMVGAEYNKTTLFFLPK